MQTNNSPMHGAAAISQMLWGAHAPAVLGAGIETGIFSALGQGPLELNNLAERIKCPARSTRILADALVALGVVTRDGSKYALSPDAANHLVPGKPMYV